MALTASRYQDQVDKPFFFATLSTNERIRCAELEPRRDQPAHLRLARAQRRRLELEAQKEAAAQEQRVESKTPSLR